VIVTVDPGSKPDQK